jgi:hypothetical protein
MFKSIAAAANVGRQMPKHASAILCHVLNSLTDAVINCVTATKQDAAPAPHSQAPDLLLIRFLILQAISSQPMAV